MAKITAARAMATLPCKDVEPMRAFFEDKLGFSVVEKTADGGFEFQAGAGTTFSIFPSSGEPSGTHTQIGFMVDNLEETVDDLVERGVQFEQYDMEDFKSDERGIVEIGGERGAWFKDPAGNLLALGEQTQ